MALYTSFPVAEYQMLKSEIDRAVARVLRSGNYILGDEVAQFEEELATYLGVRFCVSVGNGTEAIFFALAALGIGAGDEVITTPFTAAFTALAIVHTGARPVFVDIDPQTYNLDSVAVEKAITKRTKAILPVHLYGQPADMHALLRLGRKYKIAIVEDACQAHGAMIGKRMVGTMGVMGTFSFYPTKNLGAVGDGGAIVTNNKHLAEKLRLLRIGGQTKKYYHASAGYNSRLDEMQAAILRIKLRHLEKFLQMRSVIARAYDRDLTNPVIQKPIVPDGVRHAFHLYVVRTRKRTQLLRLLAAQKIYAQVHYPWPLHILPAFINNSNTPRVLPESERAAREVLSLPIYPGFSQTSLRGVVRIFNHFNSRG